LIIGIGNEWRGDDAMGIRLVKQMSQTYPSVADYYTETDDLTRLIDVWEDRKAFLVDAFHHPAMPTGKILETRRLDSWIGHDFLGTTTHSITLKSAWDLALVLHKKPLSCLIVGINGNQWNVGQNMSQEVEEAIPFVRARLLYELSMNGSGVMRQNLL
jgi:hydrogenase maturation protease